MKVPWKQHSLYSKEWSWDFMCLAKEINTVSLHTSFKLLRNTVRYWRMCFLLRFVPFSYISSYTVLCWSQEVKRKKKKKAKKSLHDSFSTSNTRYGDPNFYLWQIFWQYQFWTDTLGLPRSSAAEQLFCAARARTADSKVCALPTAEALLGGASSETPRLPPRGWRTFSPWRCLAYKRSL